MPKLKMRSTLNIVGKLPDVEKMDWEWTVPHSLDGTAKVVFSLGEETLSIEYDVDISNQLAELIGTERRRMEGLSKGLKDEIYRAYQPEGEVARKVLAHLKYTLGWREISADELSAPGPDKGLHWSLNGQEWEKTPLDPQISIGTGIGKYPLDEKIAVGLQRRLSANIEPLIARRHLHRAKDERTPRFMWIDATIAAELAIKEFFVRWEPKLETLMAKMPSPPLDLLYGKALEDFTGEPSPFVQEIKKGVETRNRLVHNPATSPPKEQDSWDYVGIVEQAIEHLEGHLRKRGLA